MENAIKYDVVPALGYNNAKSNTINNLFAEYRINTAQEALEKLEVSDTGLAIKNLVDGIFDPTSAMTERQKT